MAEKKDQVFDFGFELDTTGVSPVAAQLIQMFSAIEKRANDAALASQRVINAVRNAQQEQKTLQAMQQTTSLGRANLEQRLSQSQARGRSNLVDQIFTAGGSETAMMNRYVAERLRDQPTLRGAALNSRRRTLEREFKEEAELRLSRDRQTQNQQLRTHAEFQRAITREILFSHKAELAAFQDKEEQKQAILRRSAEATRRLNAAGRATPDGFSYDVADPRLVTRLQQHNMAVQREKETAIRRAETTDTAAAQRSYDRLVKKYAAEEARQQKHFNETEARQRAHNRAMDALHQEGIRTKGLSTAISDPNRRLGVREAAETAFNRQQVSTPVREAPTFAQRRARAQVEHQEMGGIPTAAMRMDIVAGYGGAAMAYAGFVGAASEVINFGQALQNLQAISGASTASMVSLGASVRDVASQFAFLPNEVTAAATTLAQAGLQGKAIAQTLEGVLLLAQATGSTTQITADTLTSIQTIYQRSASESVSLANMLTASINQTKLTMEQLQLGIQYAGNAAAEANIPLTELVSAFGAMANAGIKSGSTMGTNLRQFLNDLQDPSEKFVETIEGLGLTMDQLDVRTVGLERAMRTLVDAGFSGADAMQTLDVRGANVYTTLSNQLSLFQSLPRAISNTTAAQRAAEIQQLGLVNSSKLLYTNFVLLIEAVTAPALSAVAAVFRTAADALQVVTNVAQFAAPAIGALSLVAIPLLFRAIQNGIAGLIQWRIELMKAAAANPTAAVSLRALAAEYAKLSAAQAANAITARNAGTANAAAGAAAAASATGVTAAGAAATRTAGAVALLGSAGRGVMAFFGGPWGLAFTAATGALFYFGDANQRASAELVRLTQQVENANGAVEQTNMTIGQANEVQELYRRKLETLSPQHALTTSEVNELNDRFGALKNAQGENIGVTFSYGQTIGEVIPRIRAMTQVLNELAIANLRVAASETEKLAAAAGREARRHTWGEIFSSTPSMDRGGTGMTRSGYRDTAAESRRAQSQRESVSAYRAAAAMRAEADVSESPEALAAIARVGQANTPQTRRAAENQAIAVVSRIAARSANQSRAARPASDRGNAYTAQEFEDMARRVVQRAHPIPDVSHVGGTNGAGGGGSRTDLSARGVPITRNVTPSQVERAYNSATSNLGRTLFRSEATMAEGIALMRSGREASVRAAGGDDAAVAMEMRAIDALEQQQRARFEERRRRIADAEAAGREREAEALRRTERQELARVAGGQVRMLGDRRREALGRMDRFSNEDDFSVIETELKAIFLEEMNARVNQLQAQFEQSRAGSATESNPEFRAALDALNEEMEYEQKKVLEDVNQRREAYRFRLQALDAGANLEQYERSLEELMATGASSVDALRTQVQAIQNNIDDALEEKLRAQWGIGKDVQLTPEQENELRSARQQYVVRIIDFTTAVLANIGRSFQLSERGRELSRDLAVSQGPAASRMSEADSFNLSARQRSFDRDRLTAELAAVSGQLAVIEDRRRQNSEQLSGEERVQADAEGVVVVNGLKARTILQSEVNELLEQQRQILQDLAVVNNELSQEQVDSMHSYRDQLKAVIALEIERLGVYRTNAQMVGTGTANVLQSLHSGMQGYFETALRNVNDLEEAYKDMTDGIMGAFRQMAAEMLTNAVFKLLTNVVFPSDADGWRGEVGKLISATTGRDQRPSSKGKGLMENEDGSGQIAEGIKGMISQAMVFVGGDKGWISTLAGLFQKIFGSIFGSSGTSGNSGWIPQMFNAVASFFRIDGGLIPGTTRGRDHIPVLADGNEYVLRAAAVRSLGVARLDALNAMGAAALDGIAMPRVSMTMPEGVSKIVAGQQRAASQAASGFGPSTIQQRVFLVDDREKPPSIGPNDIVAAVSDSVAKRGAVYQSIKLATSGAL